MFNWFKKEKNMFINDLDGLNEVIDFCEDNKDEQNDIVVDAYYLINLFTERNKPITQLHVQKLMFLLEAYYMNKHKVEKLYNCDFKAWNFGPVAIPLYKRFSKFGKMPIVLEKKDIDKGNNVDSKRMESIKEIYNAFEGFSAIELVNFTHSKGSPWEETWNDEKYAVIPKEKTKRWFKKYISDE